MLMRRQLIKLFTGDVSLLVISGMAAQIVNLAAYPLLAQSYSPASFGAFSVVTALATFSGAAILLRFDAIIQIVDQSEDDDILSAAVVAGLGLSLAGMGLLLVFGEWLFGLIAEGQDWQAGYAIVVPALALMNGLYSLSRQYFAKTLRYRRFSVANFLRTLVMVVAQLSLVFALPGPAGLIAGFTLGLALALVLAWPVSASLLARAATAPGRALGTARAALHRYRAYIRVDVVNVLIAASVLSVYPIIVLISFGAEEAGFFAVASRLVFIPINVLGAAISTVYFQRFSLALRQAEGLVRLFSKTVIGSLVAAGSITLMVFFFAEPFVQFLFPPEWARVSIIMLFLLPTFAVRFVVGCIGSTPLALGRPKVLFVWNAVQVFILIVTWLVVRDDSLDRFLLVSGVALILSGIVYVASLLLSIRWHLLSETSR